MNFRPLPYQGKLGRGWMMPDVGGHGVYLHALLLIVAWHRPMTVTTGSLFGSLMIFLTTVRSRRWCTVNAGGCGWMALWQSHRPHHDAWASSWSLSIDACGLTRCHHRARQNRSHTPVWDNGLRAASPIVSGDTFDGHEAVAVRGHVSALGRPRRSCRRGLVVARVSRWWSGCRGGVVGWRALGWRWCAEEAGCGSRTSSW